MDKKYFFSIRFRGYFSYENLYAKAMIKGSHIKTGICDGFITADVSLEDTASFIDLLKELASENKIIIWDVRDNMTAQRQFISDYWTGSYTKNTEIK